MTRLLLGNFMQVSAPANLFLVHVKTFQGPKMMMVFLLKTVSKSAHLEHFGQEKLSPRNREAWFHGTYIHQALKQWRAHNTIHHRNLNMEQRSFVLIVCILLLTCIGTKHPRHVNMEQSKDQFFSVNSVYLYLSWQEKSRNINMEQSTGTERTHQKLCVKIILSSDSRNFS